MKILAIDDKDEARYFLEVLLSGKGYDVVSAKNGKKALEILEDQNIDFIISDILMPDMDGFEFCKIVKNNERYKNIPFVFFTATYVDKKDEEFALSLGADLFLRKPMDPDSLMKEIEVIIQKINNGTYNPHGTQLKSESDIYRLYNQRLIKKLEDKIQELEREVDKRTKAEMKLRTMIQEREILLKELYHRTRNNMQVIISMIRLYSEKLTDEACADKAIEDIINKIRTMALVHHKLYESQDLSHIDLKDYFESLMNMLRDTYEMKLKSCIIATDFEKISVLIDTAIPLGFILNELITNACEHAFPDNRNGRIDIKLSKNASQQIVLTVEDDGVGLPEDFDMHSENNIGLLIIFGMVDNQLQGKIEHVSENGLKWKVSIDREQYSARI